MDIDKTREIFSENLGKVKRGKSCWEWKGSKNQRGYGVITFSILAHRVSWEISRGPIPEGMCVLHKCDNPSCINPKHLFLGTQKDNALDMITKGRNNTVRQKLSPGNVLFIRKAYSSKRFKQRELSVMFGVCISNISQIVNRKSWK